MLGQNFDFKGNTCATLIKLKIISKLIQIETPKYLSKIKNMTLIKQIIITEKYT